MNSNRWLFYLLYLVDRLLSPLKTQINFTKYLYQTTLWNTKKPCGTPKKLLWNTKKLIWNTKKFSCNVKKPHMDYPGPFFEYHEARSNSKKLHGIPRSCPEIRRSSLEYQEALTNKSCKFVPRFRLYKVTEGWCQARRKCHEMAPKR